MDISYSNIRIALSVNEPMVLFFAGYLRFLFGVLKGDLLRTLLTHSVTIRLQMPNASATRSLKPNVGNDNPYTE